MAVKYVKEFSFGGKVCSTPKANRYSIGGRVSNDPNPIAADKAKVNAGTRRTLSPQNLADGGKVKSALSSMERKSPQEKQSIADGIANYAGGNKPGLIQRTIDAAKRANPKTTAAMGFEPPPDDYARGGKVFGRGGLPREKGSIQDPSIKPFKRPSRRGKA